MSTSNRQNSLLVAEDWKKIYQTFRQADFQSYDFETLRKAMIDYIRLYYPEDFNDFIESSEYIALIDLVAFMGQSLAFRTDLNARENFLDTAERRDSILKLARLVSYTPKRSVPAAGILKFNSVSTTEVIYDSNGLSLAGIPVNWNDGTNDNWLEQFTLILNASLLNSQVVGKSGNSQIINSIRTDEYTINIPSGTLPLYSMTATVNDASTAFEVVSATSFDQPFIYEVEPRPQGKFNFLYRNDNQGNESINTGYFLYFKQGTLQSLDYTLGESIPNRVININTNNVNNSDIWLYDLDANSVEQNLWVATPAIAGTNVIYNKAVERQLYQVNSRAGDQIDLVFGDGSFSDIPKDSFRLYFRVGNNQTYKITPDEMQGVGIAVQYVSRSGKLETLSINASLNYTVTNATANESLDDIRQKAPQQYYSQGRMITGEDYNIVPFTSFSDIIKVKAVNRTSSGVSRYLDVNDASGKYSSTNIFAEDGYLYRESADGTLSFSFVTTSSVQQVAEDNLNVVLNSKELEHYYFSTVERQAVPLTAWQLSTVATNGCTGYFYSTDTLNVTVGDAATLTSPTRYIKDGAIIKFKTRTGYYFNAQNQIVLGTPRYSGDRLYIYSSVTNLIGDGTNGGAGNFPDGTGPITLSQRIPTGALIDQVIPVFKNSIPLATMTLIANKILAYNNFTLDYDVVTQAWVIGAADAASWLISYVYTPTVGYTMTWKGLNYVFESVLETKFYFDETVKVYDSSTGLVIKDQIKVLKVNPQANSSSPLGQDYVWNVYSMITDVDGYENQSKVLVTFSDTNADGIPDNPDLFETLVDPATSANKKLVFFQKEVGYNNFSSLTPIPSSTVVTDHLTRDSILAAARYYPAGQLFYAFTDALFYRLEPTATDPYNLTTLPVGDYVAKYGREDLFFQYRHNSPGYRRIDPSPNNIIDLFLLTNSYSTDYSNWIQDSTNVLTEPVPPTTEVLKMNYGSLDNVKAISDTLIFNNAKFKPLFGVKADLAMQATFKVVKNASMNISDNDIKSSVISAINTYFAIENWDFGETFFFSELSAYLHTTLSPAVSSIIIVPVSPTSMFGSLYQINAEANEILTSAATVDNVEIISAITAANINSVTQVIITQ